MAVTSPDNIYSPDPNTPYNYIVDMRTMANSTQSAVSRIRGEIADATNPNERNVNIVPSAGNGWTLGDFRITVSRGVAYPTGNLGRNGTGITLTGTYIPVATFDGIANSRTGQVFPALSTTNIPPGVDARIISAPPNSQLQVRANSGSIQVPSFGSVGLGTSWLV